MHVENIWPIFANPLPEHESGKVKDLFLPLDRGKAYIVPVAAGLTLYLVSALHSASFVSHESFFT